jgi:hypothetical protein
LILLKNFESVWDFGYPKRIHCQIRFDTPQDGAIHVTPTKALISLDNVQNALRYREPEKRKNGLSIKINHLTEITKP